MSDVPLEHTFYNHERLPQQKDGLLPMRRDAFRACAEASNLRRHIFTSHTGPPLRSRFVTHWPYLRQCDVTLLDDLDFSASRNQIPGGCEEGVEVQDECMDLGTAFDGRDESERGGEV